MTGRESGVSRQLIWINDGYGGFPLKIYDFRQSRLD